MERKLKRSAPDTRSVDIDDDYALDFWAREFNVTKRKLKAATLVAGKLATDVKKELNK